MVVICGGGPCIPRVHISDSNLTMSGLVLSFFLSNNGHFLWYLLIALLAPGLQKGAAGPVPTYSAVVNRMQHSSPLIHKDTRTRGSSRFNISKNREIQKLPLLKGTCLHCTCLCGIYHNYGGKIWRALYLANWLFRSIGDFKFGDSLTARDVFNGRTLRLIDGCERLLELQLTSINEIKMLKGKYLWRAACNAIIFTSKFGHHSLERN